ncbi:hypothetical protein EBI_23232 [Enterocytozoon bieneusi H348]|nr:hypothetical protein EBI_23232 [Enterocytozoon bieneusi H348]|eukprot:XP_001827890.1 hypothetical protein EBI_23232 [Enterocytozoon bieneusi H348]
MLIITMYYLDDLVKNIHKKNHDVIYILSHNYWLKNSHVIYNNDIIAIYPVSNFVIEIKTSKKNIYISCALNQDIFERIITIKFNSLQLFQKYKNIYYNIKLD